MNLYYLNFQVEIFAVPPRSITFHQKMAGNAFHFAIFARSIHPW